MEGKWWVLAHGKQQSLSTLLANLLIGQLLNDSPERLAIDKEIARKLREWKIERLRLTHVS